MSVTHNSSSNRNLRSFLARSMGILQRFFNLRLHPSFHRFLDMYMKKCIDVFLYFLGPVLILLALAIILGLTFIFFTVVIPIICPEYGLYSLKGITHSAYVVFVVSNVLFNYYFCVTTTNTGEKYQAVVRELAEATGFVYPESAEEVTNSKREYEDKITERRRARAMDQSSPPVSSSLSSRNPSRSNLSNLRNRGTNGMGNSTAHSPYGWMLLGAHEWGFCLKTHQPKPPRSHYDHVTGALILNMDHYCPWMFNAVGYFNYRYFCNFLLYCFLAMSYGATILYKPFMNSSNTLYKENIRLSKQQGFETTQHIVPLVPTPSEKVQVAFSFMMCLSVGLAVFFLFFMHVYLVLTAQTTIEYHANFQRKRYVRARGITWINPYDLGWKRNWQQVYGTSHPLRALLPSTREPEFLPVPVAGERGMRRSKADFNANITSISSRSEDKSPLIARAVNARQDGMNTNPGEQNAFNV